MVKFNKKSRCFVVHCTFCKCYWSYELFLVSYHDHFFKKVKVASYLKIDLVGRYMPKDIFLYNNGVNSHQLAFSFLVEKKLAESIWRYQ